MEMVLKIYKAKQQYTIENTRNTRTMEERDKIELTLY